MKNNKKFTLIAILFVLFTSATVNAQELNCKDVKVEGFCIDIEFISMKGDYKTPSEYEFPGLAKINDYLVIRKITIINKPGIRKDANNTPGVTLKIDIYPIGFEREDIQQFQSSGNTTINISPLKVNDVYELTYQDEWGKYEARLNGQVVNEGRFDKIYPKKLFTDGDWKIDEKIEGYVGNSIINNGDWKNNFFKVYSNSEMTNLKTAESNLEIAKYSLVSSWINIVVVLLIAIVGILIQRRLAKKQVESLKEITKELKNKKKKRVIIMPQKNDYLDIVKDKRYPDVVEKDDLREFYKQNVGKTTKILLVLYAAVISLNISLANYNNFPEIWFISYNYVVISAWLLLVIISIALIRSLWNPKEEFEKYLKAVKKLKELKESEQKD